MDRKKVIKSIEDCVFHNHDCVDCDYDGCVFEHGDCRRDLLADALALLKEQQQQIWELQDKVEYLTDKLKEQKFLVDSDGKITPLPVVVRCKDCEWRGNKKKCILAFIADKQEFPLFFYDQRGEWFCADGKRKEEE